MKKIMIVEDDEVIKDELSELLKNSSYLVESVKNFEKAKEEIFKYNPDLILLDINIPYLNGELLLKEIRKESSVPVIMVTSKSGEIDEALSITYGADDYITKPYNPTILLLRIQNIFKRINQNNNALKYKDIIVDLNKSELKKDDKVLVLTKNEMIIFSYLFLQSANNFTTDFFFCFSCFFQNLHNHFRNFGNCKFEYFFSIHLHVC